MPEPALRSLFDEALETYDRPGAVAVALEAVDRHSVSIPELYNVLSEILIDLGAKWQAGTTEVWQEHLVTGVVRNIVEACVLRVEQAAPKHLGPMVVLAAPEDEYHDLGLRMLADRFRLGGWSVRFLGANVPLRELIAAVDALAADAVALSASTHYHRMGLESFVASLAEARPTLRIWVGGPAFALDQTGWAPDQVLDPLDIPRPEIR